MKQAARWSSILTAFLLTCGLVHAQGASGLADLDAILKPATPVEKPAAAAAAPVETNAVAPAVAAVPAAEIPVAAATNATAVVPVAEVPAAAVANAAAGDAATNAPAVSVTAPVAAVTAPAPVADAVATNADAGREGIVSELLTLEKLRRNALREHGMLSLNTGRKAMRDGDYEEARKQFEMALDYIPDNPETRSARDEARNGVREALYRNAILIWKKGDREKAVQIARQATEKGHPDAAKLAADIQKEIDTPPVPPRPREIPRMLEAGYKDERDEVMRHLRVARQYFVVGEYDRTRLELEIILRDHPYNTEAMEMLRKVGDRTYDVSNEEFDATRSKMIRDVKASWSPRRYAIDTVTMNEPSASRPTNGKAVGPSGLTVEQQIEQKMKTIVLPEITFRNANINDVVSFFESASREHDDPSLPVEKRGVNFVLKNIAGTAPVSAAPATTDPFATSVDSGAASVGGGTPITFSARFVSLWEALKIVTEVAGYKSRIRGNVVMVMPLNQTDEVMETRSYTVLPTLTDRITGVGRELASAKTGGTGSGDFGTMAATGSLTEKTDWKKFFEQLGVTWPQGSSISYLSTIGKLRVVNTSENLAIFETALEDLNVTPRQIEIEARFVEVSQDDLDSLGVQWGQNAGGPPFVPWGSPDKTTGQLRPGKMGIQFTPVNTLVADPLGGVKGGLTGGLRYLSNGTALGSTVTAADSLLNIRGVFDNLDISMVLHMLSQRSNTDLLSAPKVVTKAGQEAVMKVVTEYIYPTTFAVVGGGTTAGTTATTTTGTAVEPGGFQTREVGVILQVVPEVSAEGQMINLTMNPQVVSEPVWKDYGYDIPITPTPTSGPTTTHIPMQQPFFQVRSISTSVSIYNGATVVMGGMITEVRSSSEDKIPFLGDLPYIGQAFRSKAEKTTKRNLLIFVTARLVDPAGRSLKTTLEPTLGGEKLKNMVGPVKP